MSNPGKAYGSLRDIVLDCQIEMDDHSKDNYARMMHFAINGYRDFRRHHFTCIKQIFVPVDQTLYSFDYPDDLIKLKAVGVPIDGEIWEFTEIKSKIKPQCDEINEDRQELDRRNFRPVRTYGMQPYNQYLYTSDDDLRRGYIFGPIADEVQLNYEATGYNLDEDVLVPDHAYEALKALVHYKMVKFSSAGLNMKQFERDNMNAEIVKMREIINRFSVNDLLDSIRSGYRQSYKR